MTISVITKLRSAGTCAQSVAFAVPACCAGTMAPEVMFTSITFFTSLDAIHGFAGDDFELAVVEETARQALSRWDERVSHHQVVADLE